MVTRHENIGQCEQYRMDVNRMQKNRVKVSGKKFSSNLLPRENLHMLMPTVLDKMLASCVASRATVVEVINGNYA